MTIINFTESKRYKDRNVVSTDSRLNNLMNMSPHEAANWVEANVNSFDEAKDLLKTLAKVCVYLGRKSEDDKI